MQIGCGRVKTNFHAQGLFLGATFFEFFGQFPARKDSSVPRVK